MRRSSSKDPPQGHRFMETTCKSTLPEKPGILSSTKIVMNVCPGGLAFKGYRAFVTRHHSVPAYFPRFFNNL